MIKKTTITLNGLVNLLLIKKKKQINLTYFLKIKLNKKEIKYEWIYHIGFEKVKADLINKSTFDFKKGCHMFYKKYGNILGNINKL